MKRKVTEKKRDFKKPIRFSSMDIILAFVSFLIAANLAFGPVMITISGRSVKLFDNILLFFIWTVLVLLRYMSKRKFGLPQVMSFVSKYRYELGLIAVLSIVGALRFMSIGYGLPHLAEQHEKLIVPKVLEMIRKGTLDHGIYDYGSLYFIFLYLVFILSAFVAGIIGVRINSISNLDQAFFFITARAANVILSLISIYLVYLIGKRISGKMTGLAAATITAFGTILFLNSITARLELLVLVFVLLAFYYMVRLSKTGKIIDYSLSGLFIGLAVGTKFYSVTIFAALVYAHFLTRKLKTFSNRKLLVAIMIMVLGYLITNPFILTDTESFLRDTSRLSRELSVKEHWSSEANSPEAVYSGLIFRDGLGIIGTIIFLMLFILFLIKPDVEKGLLLVFPIVHFLVLAKSRFVFHRYILIILPFLALFMACKLEELFVKNNKKRLKWHRNIVFWGIVLLIALFPAVKMFRIAGMYSLETTSSYAAAWIERNIPPGTRLLVSPYSVDLKKRQYFIAKMSKASRRYSRDLISLPEKGFNYIITSSTLKNYGLLNGTVECIDLVKKFEPVVGKIAGRTIYILKVQPAPSSQLKKSESWLLNGRSKESVIEIGNPKKDLLYLSSDWGDAGKEDGVFFRTVRKYPAVLYFSLSPTAVSHKNASISVNYTTDKLEGINSTVSLEIKLNESVICNNLLNLDGKKYTQRCMIPSKLLKNGKTVNKLELDIPEVSKLNEGEEASVMTIPRLKYHSVSIKIE